MKKQKLAEMKMEGIDFEERMLKLDELEYPKPDREFIYSSFNEFAAKHPWIGQENIRPKSIVREMAESGELRQTLGCGDASTLTGPEVGEPNASLLGGLTNTLTTTVETLASTVGLGQVQTLVRDNPGLTIGGGPVFIARDWESSGLEIWQSATPTGAASTCGAISALPGRISTTRMPNGASSTRNDSPSALTAALLAR